MKQLVYKNKFYLCGKFRDVSLQLKELSARFVTVKDFLDYYTRKLY